MARAPGLGKMNKHSSYFLKANNSALETREFPTSRMAVEVSVFGQSNRNQFKEPQSEAQRVSWRLENQNGTKASPAARKQEASNCLGQREVT